MSKQVSHIVGSKHVIVSKQVWMSSSCMRKRVLQHLISQDFYTCYQVKQSQNMYVRPHRRILGASVQNKNIYFMKINLKCTLSRFSSRRVLSLCRPVINKHLHIGQVRQLDKELRGNSVGLGIFST